MRGLLFSLFVAGAAAAAGAQSRPSAPAPTPVPNLLAPVLSEALLPPAPAVAATQEWMVIQAARVIEDWKTMREQAERLAQRYPSEGDVYVALGGALEGLGLRADAVAALERAAELKPAHKGAWLLLAILQSSSGEQERAAAAFERGIALAPTDARLLWGAALAYARMGDHGRSAAAFARVVGAYPSDVNAWVAYAPEAVAAGRAEPMWTAFNGLRMTRPDIAARVAASLPAELQGALPTPIPPTPRATARPDAPRLVMGGGAAGASGRSPAVWSATALSFDSKVAPIAQKARPLTEMMQRYEMTCRGGHGSRPSDSGTAGDEGQPRSGSGGGSVHSPAGAAVDWATVWARSAAWGAGATGDGTAECRTLASEMLALANGTRAAVEAAVKETAGSGISETERSAILEKYGLRW